MAAFTTCKALSQALREHHAQSKSWPATGRKFGISGGMAYRVAVDGYEPKDAHIRTTLNLPTSVATPVCPVHGVVHARSCRIVPERVSQAADWMKARERH